MQRRNILLPLGLLVIGSTACRKQAPEVAPIPVDNPVTPPPPPPPPPPSNPGENPTEVTLILRAEVEQNTIHFDYNLADIKPEDRPILDRKADIMRANPGVRIRISGHADERGSDEYNLVLGNQRAQAAKAYLQGRGIDGGRIEITSYGEERPVDRAGTEDAWAKNRRDEFEIIGGGGVLVRPR